MFILSALLCYITSAKEKVKEKRRKRRLKNIITLKGCM